ncbi:uncharacterized protein LOC143905645 [Temnothorax americanus]|uniref:uncharacterized protein LOC143905645 n=1 Tax=Temnothorax americanus TaxID=1964332 RepID=UPI004068DAA4
MDKMFGHKPWMNPILTLDSANDIPSGSSICSNSDTTSPSPEMSLSPSLLTSTNERPKKRKKVEETALEDLVAIAKENKEERKNMYEETATRQERLLHILENIANKM